MTALLCPAHRCRHHGSHKPDCDGCDCPTARDSQHGPRCQPCQGCQPRQLAPGYHLCWWHADHIGPDAIRCAQLHTELAQALTGGGGQTLGDHGDQGHGVETGININSAVIERRREIRAVLTSWAKLIAEDRGIAPPDPDEASLAAFIDRHATWLAAQEFAHEAADELAGQRQRATGLLQPNNRHSFQVGPCDQHDCHGTVIASLRPADTLLPPAVRCATCGYLTPSHQWHKLRKVSA